MQLERARPRPLDSKPAELPAIVQFTKFKIPPQPLTPSPFPAMTQLTRFSVASDSHQTPQRFPEIVQLVKIAAVCSFPLPADPPKKTLHLLSLIVQRVSVGDAQRQSAD